MFKPSIYSDYRLIHVPFSTPPGGNFLGWGRGQEQLNVTPLWGVGTQRRGLYKLRKRGKHRTYRGEERGRWLPPNRKFRSSGVKIFHGYIFNVSCENAKISLGRDGKVLLEWNFFSHFLVKPSLVLSSKILQHYDMVNV